MAGEKVQVIRDRLPKAPPQYDQENEQKLRRILELATIDLSSPATPGGRDGKDGRPGRPGVLIPGRGGIGVRRTKRFTGPIGGYETEITLDGAGVIFLSAMSEFEHVWLRIYSSENARARDRARDVNQIYPVATCILDVYFTEKKQIVQLFDGDVDGVLAFNRDDRSTRKFYVSVKTPFPGQYLLQAFLGTLKDFGEHPFNAVYLNWTYFSPESGGMRYRVQKVEAGQRVPGVYAVNTPTTPQPASLAAEVFKMDDLTNMSLTSALARAWLDTGSFEAYHCYYLQKARYNLPYLRVGFSRASVNEVQGAISWVDSTGTAHNLLTDPSPPKLLFPKHSTPGHFWTAQMRTEVYQDAEGVTRARVFGLPGQEYFGYLHDDGSESFTFGSAGAWKLLADVAVPNVVAQNGQRGIGLELHASTVPEATLAFGGLSFIDLSVPVGGLNITLGYAPLEPEGGTIAPAVPVIPPPPPPSP